MDSLTQQPELLRYLPFLFFAGAVWQRRCDSTSIVARPAIGNPTMLFAPDSGFAEPISFDEVRTAVRGRSIVLVGMMGAGKSRIGRILASFLDLRFVDSDSRIEKQQKRAIGHIIEREGAGYFRSVEARMIRSILAGRDAVIATGDGAFMNEDTRVLIRQRAISIWLKANPDSHIERVSRRADRAILEGEELAAAVPRLIVERYPIYATADIIVESGELSANQIGMMMLLKLRSHMRKLESQR